MRLELFFKTGLELRSIISMLRCAGINAVNLTNKVKTDPMLSNIATLKEALPDLDICQHYSFKYQYRRDADSTYAAFKTFLREAEAGGASEVLLLTGSGPKKDMNSLSCLQRLAAEKSRPGLRLGVAFNPFFPDLDDRKAEQQRLKAKLCTGLVGSVYLQIGTDLQALRQGLEFLKTEGEGCHVVGSVLVPSRRLLAQMKFRPWNGVWLSAEYLSGVEQADSITRSIIDMYTHYEVEAIVETAVKEADLDRLQALLGPLYHTPHHTHTLYQTHTPHHTKTPTQTHPAQQGAEQGHAEDKEGKKEGGKGHVGGTGGHRDDDEVLPRPKRSRR